MTRNRVKYLSREKENVQPAKQPHKVKGELESEILCLMERMSA